MRRPKRRTLILVVVCFVVIVTATIIFIVTVDWNKAKPYVAAAASKATGRQWLINGDLEVDFGWISRIRADRIQLENAEWSSQAQMAEVGRVEVEIDLWQLLRNFRLVFPSVNISRPEVLLETNADGSANWDFRPTPAATKSAMPHKRAQFPVIQKLIIEDGSILFADRAADTRLELNLARAEATGFIEEPVKLRAEGTYQQQPLTLSLDGGSYENLKNSDEPYPLRIQLGVGKLKAAIDGNLTEPLEMKGEDVTLDIQGDDMANLFPLIRLVFPSTPPYRLKGHLKHDGNLWSFSNFSGRVGDSDLSGDIVVETGRKRPLLKADVTSDLLDFDDLAGFIGGTPTTAADETAAREPREEAAGEKESDRIFPDQRYDLKRLNAMDADVRLRAKRILAPDLPIDNLNANLNLSDGVLRFAPAAFGVANGRVEIYSRFDGSKQRPNIDIDVRLRQMDLKRFLGRSSFAQKSIGPIGGRIALAGSGNSFRDLMATASGTTLLVMSRGEISALLIELAGLDVTESLGFLIRGDESIPVRCGVLNLQGKDGKMGVETFVFDTADTVILGEGEIDLGDERVDLVLTPVPKDFSPLSLRSFVRASGRFKDLSVFPDPFKIGTQSVIAKVFNVFLMIALSPFQPRDLGLAQDIDCDALIAAVQQKDPHGAVPREFYEPGGSKKTPGDRRSAQRHARTAQ